MSRSTKWRRWMSRSNWFGRSPKPVWEALEPRVLLSAAVSAVELQIDTPATGQMTDPAVGDTYGFPAHRGQQYTIETSLDTLEDSDLTLLNTDGQTQLDYSDDVSDGDYSSQIIWTAPDNGVYYINVGSVDGGIGEYQVTVGLSQNDSTPPEPLREELPVPLMMNQTTDGDLHDATRSDLYSFQALAGHKYTFQTILGSVTDTDLTLLDTDGTTELEYNDDASDGDYSSLIQWQAPADGTYFIRLNSVDDSAGDYQLSAIEETSSSNTPASPSTDELPANGSVTGYLQDPDAGDLYTFRAQANHRYVFKTTLVETEDTYLSLLDTDGITELASNDDVSDDDRSSKIVWRAPADGDYFLQVFSDGSTGEYELTSKDITNRGPATPMNVGKSVKGSLADVEDEDLYSFTAAAGESYAFHLGGRDEDYGSLVLLAKDGKTVLSSIDTSGVFLPLLWKAPSDGTYFIAVNSEAQDFNYTLFSKSVPGFDAADHLSLNRPVKDTIANAADVHLYQFHAQAGTQYNLRTTWPGDDYIEIDVLNADGSLAQSFDWNDGGSEQLRQVWTAQQSGIYYIQLANGDYDESNSAIDYTFRITALPGSDTAVAVSIRDSAKGKIDNADDAAWFSISVVGGQIYNLKALGANLTDTTMAIWNQDRSKIQEVDYNEVWWTAPETGTYLIEVAGILNNTGGFRFTVSDAASILAQATSIQVNDSLDGNITQAGQNDQYKFEAIAGTTYVFETSLDGLEGTDLVLNGTDGVTELTDDWEEEDSSWIEWTAPESGTYYLSVSGSDASYTGGYQLSVSVGTYDSNDDPPADPNPDPTPNPDPVAIDPPPDVHEEPPTPQADLVITPNIPYLDAISLKNGPIRRYQFQAVGGVNYTIGATIEGLPYIQYYLLDQDGSTQINSSYASSYGYSAPCLINWTAPTSGTYYVGTYVSIYYLPTGASYALEVTANYTTNPGDSSSPASSPSLDSILAQARLIAPGDSLNFSISSVGWQNVFSFQALAGITYAFETDFDPSHGSALALLDRNGMPIQTTGLYASNGRTIEWFAPTDGTYYIVAAAELHSALGSHTLTYVASEPIAPGNQLSGNNQTFAQEDIYTFNALAGHEYDFEASLSDNTTYNYLYLRFLKPDGQETAVMSVVNPSVHWYAFTPTESGTFTIVVSATPWWISVPSFGQYTLSMTDRGEHHVDDPPRSLTPGDHRIGQIATPGQDERFAIQATAGHEYQFNTRGTVNTQLFLVTADGPAASYGEYWGGSINWIAPADGTFYLVVCASDFSSVGQYLVDMTDYGDNANAMIVPGRSVGFVGKGTRVNGQLFAPGKSNRFRFDAVAGHRYSFSTILPEYQALPGTHLVVSDQAGSLVVDQESGETSGEQMTWTAPADESYYVTVSASDSQSLGRYTLSIVDDDYVPPISVWYDYYGGNVWLDTTYDLALGAPRYIMAMNERGEASATYNAAINFSAVPKPFVIEYAAKTPILSPPKVVILTHTTPADPPSQSPASHIAKAAPRALRARRMPILTKTQPVPQRIIAVDNDDSALFLGMAPPAPSLSRGPRIADMLQSDADPLGLADDRVF